MQNQWNEHKAKATIEQYAGVSEDIALRVYTSRLIGADPSLVLHGGGKAPQVAHLRSWIDSKVSKTGDKVNWVDFP